MSDTKELPTGDAVLQRVLYLIAPVVRLLLRHGINHQRFAAALKRVFLDEAAAELHARGLGTTYTALSLLSGLQRRDVRALLEGPSLPRKATSPSLAMQVLTLWVTDPRYADADDEPIPLPLRAAQPDEPSFAQLVAGVSKDVHAQSVADELERLGLVRERSGRLELASDQYRPTGSHEQMLDALCRNARDHLSAAVTNVLHSEPRFLEYSLVADELRPESAQEMQHLARKLWRHAHKRSAQAAQQFVERDRALGFGDVPNTRIRFGVYFYSEPVTATAAAPPSADRDNTKEGVPS